MQLMPAEGNYNVLVAMAGRSSVYLDRDIYEAIETSARSIGVESVKESQRQAMVELLKGLDVFVLFHGLRQGSICFGLLPLVFDHLRGINGSIVIVQVHT